MVKSSDDIYHNSIIYAYENGCVDIIAADCRMFREPGWEEEAKADDEPRRAPREPEKKSEGDDMLRSMRRARSKLRRLALANDFTHFVTLTLDAAQVDRYDPKVITRKLNSWCNNMVQRHGLRYILVPERHKDGAIHFHGFFAGEMNLVDSGHKDSTGATIYNLPQWRLGFSTAIRLRGEYPRAVSYCCKYIGKQEGQRPMGRWYYSGGALKEPPRMYADLDFDELKQAEGCFEFEIPTVKMLVIHTKKEEN